MSISLPQNIASVQSPEDMKRQLGELVKVLEDYLNRTATVYYRDNQNQPNPSMKKGDLLIDAAISPPSIIAYEWNGIELQQLTGIGVTGPTGATGTAGVGVPPGGLAGYVLAKDTDADFDTAWINAQKVIAAAGVEPVSDGNLPNPELVFDDSDGDVVVAS